MEGPSLLIASEYLSPFEKKQIKEVSGNTKIGKERLVGKTVLDIFSWGKHLVFQFDDFAMRVHFMLYGTYAASFNGKSLTGDYSKKGKPIRLEMVFEKGTIDLYSCSIKYIEDKSIKANYDFSADIMSDLWDTPLALGKIRKYPPEEIADVLLDQEIFAGVGNIIKNEVLFIVKINPQTLIKNLSEEKLLEITIETQKFSHNFYKWRKKFELKKHYKIYRKSICPICGGKVKRLKTGKRNRVSYFCPIDQPLNLTNK